MKILSRSLLFFLTFCTALSGAAEDQIISRQMIQQSGIIRISDIVMLIEGWHSLTMDGFRWNTHPLETHISRKQNWILMVDNQRIDLEAFNQKNLNMLPFNIDCIDSIVVSTTPWIHGSHFSEFGTIHIHTSEPKSGVTFDYRYAAGNETGDPGPYALTAYATPNVDRIANDQFSTLSVGLKNFWGRIGFGLNQFAASDQVLLKRLDGYPWEWLRTYVFSPFMQIGTSSFGGKHRLYAGYASAGDSPLGSRDGSDLLFFNPLGKEVPVEHSFLHAGLDGLLPLNSFLSISYQYKQSINTVENAENYYTADFDWHMKNDYGHLALQFTNSRWNGEIGFGYDRFHLDTKYNLTKSSVSLTKFFGNFNWNLMRIFHPDICFHLTTNGQQTTGKTSIKNTWKLNPVHHIEAGVSYSQRLPDEDNDFWFWANRGYDLLNKVNIHYMFDGGLQKNHHMNLYLDWRCGLQKSLLSIKGFVHWHKNVITEEQNDDCTGEKIWESPVTVHTRVSGNVIGSQLRFRHSMYRDLDLQFSYINTFPLNSNKEFENEYQCFPKHKAFIALNYLPVPSFSLHANFTFLSDMKWFEYKNVNRYASGLYDEKMQKIFLLNFSAQKWMWKKRIRIGLMFYNCLNDKIQYHPMGASFDLSVFLNVVFQFNFVK